MIRHLARKNNAPAIHKPSRSPGRNAEIEFLSDVVARFRSIERVVMEVVALPITAVLAIAEGAV